MRAFVMKLESAVLVVSSIAFCSTAALAQANENSPVHADKPSASLPVFKSQSILVQVPVVVTDKAGSAVHALSKEDFKVFEDGKEQKIAVMEEIKAGGGPMTEISSPGTFSNTYVNAAQPRAVTVIALDTVNTPFLDQEYARSQMIRFLSESIDHGQTISVLLITPKGVATLSDLTTDSAVVVNVLKKLTAQPALMETFSPETQARAATSGGLGSGLSAADVDAPVSPNTSRAGAVSALSNSEARLQNFLLGGDTVEAAYWQDRATECTFQAFLEIAWSLAGIPGRKSLVWVTGGFPFYIDSAFARPPDPRLARLYERTLEALNDAQVSVYPLDARGLVDSPIADAAATRPLGGLRLNSTMRTLEEVQQSRIAMFNTFSDMTGGRSLYNNNDLTLGIRRAVDDSSSYYMLSYYLDRRGKNGWRKLHVDVQGKDLKVRARSGFLASASRDPESVHHADVNFALNSQLDSTEIPFQVHLQSKVLNGPAAKTTEFEIAVPAASVIDEADNNRFDVEFVWQMSQKGHTLNQLQQTIKGKLDDASLARVKRAGVRYQNKFDLTPGTYQLRFVVRDNRTGKLGSVSAPLVVN